MKIAFVNDTFIKGRGADHVVFEIARRLGKKHEVNVITNRADFSEDNFKIIELGGRKLLVGNWKDFLGIFQIFKFREFADKFDVINLHHSTLSFVFLGKKNVVVTSHGNPPTKGEKSLRRFFRNIANSINIFLLRYNKKTTAISEYAKKDLMKSFVPEDKIEIIYDGIGDEFNISRKKDKRFMFFIGRHEGHKKISELIRISKELNFQLKIAGKGPKTKELIRLAGKLNAPVEFLGRISEKDKIKHYQECSFFVSASRWEEFGLIFLEAGASGKPSVAYKVCSIPEVVKDKETGFLAENYNEFKEYVKLFIKNEKLRKDMGKKAENFSKRFNWDLIANQYEEVLKTIKINV